LLVILRLKLLKLEENEAEFKVIAAAKDDDALVTDEFMEVIISAADAEL
jgi:hypothetical protein